MGDVGFRRHYATWRSAPLPTGSRDDELDELRADLVLVDLWVTETVVPFVECGVYLPASNVNVLGELTRLRACCSTLAQGKAQEQQEEARAYLAYAELLRQVYASFLALKA